MAISDQTKPVRITCIEQGKLADSKLATSHLNWLEQNRFHGQAGRLVSLPGADGSVQGYAFGLGEAKNRHPLIEASAAAQLSDGRYELVGASLDRVRSELAFKLGTYRFTKYQVDKDQSEPANVELVSAGKNSAETDQLVEAAFLARDLINTPANDLGPDAFEKEIRSFAKQRKMKCAVISGDELLEKNFPMIHAVGRASAEAPRLLDLSWGEAKHPKITLVGKGVTFDTGGLDIKSPAGMVIMKKDMGGAANILGLAHAIVAAKLKVRLRVLLPVVENSISANAFRPGDILPSRAGLQVEIGNTDAEGRLILADALALASEENPQFLLDMATLTGAARVALGPELPPLYTQNDALAQDLMHQGRKWGDPLWHMPLWHNYDASLKSRIADVNHISSGGFAGSITAALFLQRFVKTDGDWVHLDIYGWAPEAKPGRSQGGTDQGIRAAFAVLKHKYPA